MRTPATIARHPLHPMLIVFPVGLWIFSLICDFISLGSSDVDAAALWSVVALYTMVGGTIGALLAAIPGFIDLLSIANPDVKKIAITHMSINLAAVVLYVVNAWLRFGGMESGLPIGLSVFTVLMVGVAGWLGGEMVHVHGVAVEPASSDRRHTDSPQQAIGVGERRMTRHGA